MNVASLRARRGVTQERLAEKMSVSARYVKALKLAKSLSLPTLVKMRAALRCRWEGI